MLCRSARRERSDSSIQVAEISELAAHRLQRRRKTQECRAGKQAARPGSILLVRGQQHRRGTRAPDQATHERIGESDVAPPKERDAGNLSVKGSEPGWNHRDAPVAMTRTEPLEQP